MQATVKIDLDQIENEWGETVSSAVKGEIDAQVRKLVREWFAAQKVSFTKQLDKFGLHIIDKAIVEKAVKSFLLSTLPAA